MEAVLFIGLQASGKSSFYARYFSRTHLRLNLDMLKTRHRERRLLETCLEIRQRFVIDNTNPRREDRLRYIPPAKAAGFRVVGFFFEAALEECLARNRRRPGRERIPDAGLIRAFRQLETPDWREGFDALYRVRLGPRGFSVSDWEGRRARAGWAPDSV